MKPWLLFFCLTAATATTQAAPARKAARPQWEYAVLEIGYGINGGQAMQYRPKLSLPGNKTITLTAKDARSSAYKAYILNRLGSQGWELFIATGNKGDDYHYIFRRRK